ncbi:MAG: flavodoxin domain-containing protein [Bacteroidota bacterium]
MNAIIIYKGKYGATKQYATWLGEELELSVQPTSIINREQLDRYDTFLIGTSVYIGKLQVKKWMKQNQSFLQHKKIFLFQVAATPPEQKDKRQSYNLEGIPPELAGCCECYFLPGKMCMDKLSWRDRVLLKMGARLEKNENEKRRMLTDYDEVKREHLAEIIAGVNEYFGSVRPPIPVKSEAEYR